MWNNLYQSDSSSADNSFDMSMAYRGFSVILLGPDRAHAARGPGGRTSPVTPPAMFTGLFMKKMVVFFRLY